MNNILIVRLCIGTCELDTYRSLLIKCKKNHTTEELNNTIKRLSVVTSISTHNVNTIKMFIAKFQQVNSIKFDADKNNNMPFIGEVLAGTATGTIINGTMFQREGLKPLMEQLGTASLVISSAIE